MTYVIAEPCIDLKDNAAWLNGGAPAAEAALAAHG
jgi:hypothetical protein